MLSFCVLVRYGTEITDLSYLEPGECSVVSIINDARKEKTGKGMQLYDNWKLSVLFPWNGERHTLISNEELMIAFEAFDSQSEDKIEFEISLDPVGVEDPEEPIELLTFNNEAPPATAEKYDCDEDDSYEVDEEIDDSEVSLDEELCEEGEDFFHCDPDGDATIFQGSSNNDNRLTRMAKAAMKGYAIQEEFRLKKIKNDGYRYIVACKNDACDWRLHASCLPDGNASQQQSQTVHLSNISITPPIHVPDVCSQINSTSQP
ncbi:hypothetical protein ACOSP7_004886 [Xanthoceras sorbifolium]